MECRERDRRRLGGLAVALPERRRDHAAGRGVDLLRERRLRPGSGRRPRRRRRLDRAGQHFVRGRRQRPRRLGRSDPAAGRATATTRTPGSPARSCRPRPGSGPRRSLSFDRQPEILAFEADNFGPYPFSASGGVVDDVDVGFALENQTRPTYSPFFFGGPEGNDFVVVHELAHSGSATASSVDTWQDIWLNEGFATYAEWLWSEREGFGTAQENFDFARTGSPTTTRSGQLAIGDPGPVALFDFPVYARGAMTLQALRNEVGDNDFFQILKEWAKTQAGKTVTTAEFIALAERISHKELDALFDAWLSAGKPAGYAAAPAITTGPLMSGRAVAPTHSTPIVEVPAEPPRRNLAERLRDRPGNPFKNGPLKGD